MLGMEVIITRFGSSDAAVALASPQSTMGHRWDRSARRVEKLRARLNWRAGAVPDKPRGMHEKTYQRILGQLAYHEAVRRQGASYARKYMPDQHYAHLWRQCRNRFAGLGGWPLR
jgi:hypothetical protein